MYEELEMERFYSYNLMSATVKIAGLGKEEPALKDDACKGIDIAAPAGGITQQINASGFLTVLCIMVCIVAILGIASMSFGVGAQAGNKLSTGSNITTASPSGEQQFDLGSSRPQIAELQEVSNATALQLTFRETDNLRDLQEDEPSDFIIESVSGFAVVNNSPAVYIFELPDYQPST